MLESKLSLAFPMVKLDGCPLIVIGFRTRKRGRADAVAARSEFEKEAAGIAAEAERNDSNQRDDAEKGQAVQQTLRREFLQSNFRSGHPRPEEKECDVLQQSRDDDGDEAPKRKARATLERTSRESAETESHQHRETARKNEMNDLRGHGF